VNALLPAKVVPYAKAWVALFGVLVNAVVIAWPSAPDWLVIVASVLTAAGVYLTPNTPNVDER
jgi:hypothetical protein